MVLPLGKTILLMMMTMQFALLQNLAFAAQPEDDDEAYEDDNDIEYYDPNQFVDLIVPEQFRGLRLRLRHDESVHDLTEDRVLVRRSSHRSRVEILDRHWRIVAAASPYLNENSLNSLRFAKWRVGLSAGQYHPHRGDINKNLLKSSPSALKAQSIEIGYQPSAFGLALTLESAESRSRRDLVQIDYQISSLNLLTLYEHVPYTNLPMIQFGYIIGYGRAVHNLTFREKEFEIEINEKSVQTNGIQLGYQLRVAPGIGQIWLTGRYLYGVFTREKKGETAHRSKTYIYSTAMLGAQLDF